MRTFGKPMLPRGILHELVELRAGPGGYDPDNGGQWVRSEPERIPFQGVVLVVSEDDWQKAPQGTFTRNSRKIYTNGHALGVGSRVYDPESGRHLHGDRRPGPRCHPSPAPVCGGA